MKIMGVNVLVVLVAFALTLSGLVYAREYERALNVDRPLSEVLESTPWVERYLLDSSRGEIVVYSGWDEQMPSRLESLLESALDIGGDRYQLVRIIDTRTPELEEMYYDVHLAVNQGLATGDYLTMKRELDGLAEVNGIDLTKVWVSSSSASVLLRHGDHFMYERIGESVDGNSGLEVRFEGP